MRSGRAAFRVVQGGRTSRSCGLPPSLRRRPEGPRIHGSRQSSSTGKHLRRDGRRRRDRAPDGQRARARRLPRLGVPHRGRRAGHRGAAARTARRSSTRSSGPKARRWASSSSRRRSAAAPTAASSASSRGCRKGLRKPLYIRDDDYRLSFAYGNFATLSNLKERDIARILEYRLSPLYVSVHATPWEARKVLLNNPRVPNIVEQLTRLAEGGIQFHGQMVVVPGPQRRRRARAVARAISGTSATRCCRSRVVPVGLTQFSHLYTGKSMDAENARRAPRRASSGGSARALRRARRSRGSTARTSSTCSPDASCPAPSTTATSRRSRTASARSPSLRERVRDGLDVAAAARRQAHRRRDRRRRWRR